ncbi:MAG: hypothetical protein H7273_09180, partial [Polaromonas sp.]|nr:hypothetical protein [Polaromonas sp.]
MLVALVFSATFFVADWQKTAGSAFQFSKAGKIPSTDPVAARCPIANMQLVAPGPPGPQDGSANAPPLKHPEYLMKKFLSILASAAVLAMPLAVISAPAAAQTGAPAAAPAKAPMAAPAAKAKQTKAKATQKARNT